MLVMFWNRGMDEVVLCTISRLVSKVLLFD